MLEIILKGLGICLIIGLVSYAVGKIARIYAVLSSVDILVQLPYEMVTQKLKSSNKSQIVVLIISMIFAGIYILMNHNDTEKILETFFRGTAFGTFFCLLADGIEPISIPSLIATAFSSVFLFGYAKYSFSGSANILLKLLSNVAVIFISALLAIYMTPVFEAGGNLCVSLFEKVVTVVNEGSLSNIKDIISFTFSAISLCIMALLALFCLLLTIVEYVACFCYGVPVLILFLVIPSMIFDNIYPGHPILISNIFAAVSIVAMEIIRSIDPFTWNKIADDLA